ncbi:unnamed protein product [Pylaiella littoralis]
MPRRRRPVPSTATAAAVGVLWAASALSGALGAQSADSKYDSGTTMFSPKGRLYQVEYAAQAVARARPAVGICTDEGIVLCSLKTIHNKRLQVGDQRVKTSLVDSHVVCTSAGLTADAMVLVKDCRVSAQQHSLTFQEPIPVQKLASHVADVKQAYTQHGGLRPWGVSMLLAGWDESRGFQLYKTEPSGNFGAFKAVAVGAGASRLSAEVAAGYREAVGGKAVDGGGGGGGSSSSGSMGLAEAVRLAAGVLNRERAKERKSRDIRTHAKAGKEEEEEEEGESKAKDGRDQRNDFGDVGMEIATIAVERDGGGGGGTGRGASASAYIYSDAEVERVLETLGDGGGEEEGGVVDGRSGEE